jgi:hypothetical protein
MNEKLILGGKSFDVKMRSAGDNFTLFVNDEEFNGSYVRTIDGGPIKFFIIYKKCEIISRTPHFYIK